MAFDTRICGRIFLNGLQINSLGLSRIFRRILSGARNNDTTNQPNYEVKSDVEREDVEEFRTYEIPGLKVKEKTKGFVRQRKLVPPPRYLKMPTDQAWPNVWPASTTFKQSVVPMPIRQGYSENSGENQGISPGKYGNAELMKIPNFLHLTPAHIKAHCAAIKEFCTDWPVGLETDDDCTRHFPVEVMTSDYLFSSPSIRDPRARTVTVKMKLSTLELNAHAHDKFVRLVGDRYDQDTDMLTFTTDRCPTKKQNYDYIQYLLTACYFESWRTEKWETEKTEEDMESFTWHMTPNKETVLTTLKAIQKNQGKSDEELSDADLLGQRDLQRYRDAVTLMADEGENAGTISQYKQSVLRMLQIPVQQG